MGMEQTDRRTDGHQLRFNALWLRGIIIFQASQLWQSAVAPIAIVPCMARPAVIRGDHLVVLLFRLPIDSNYCHMYV